MTETEKPQLCLITPPEPDPSRLTARLLPALDAAEVACVRLSLPTRNEDQIIRAADALRDLCHARDIALLIDDHVLMVGRLGLDGVHLTDAARSVRGARRALGADAIVGAFCGASRHDGMTAGEAGADYVCFGPAGATTLGRGERAGVDLFQWWSELIEIPVVAEGALGEDTIPTLAPVADFLAIGEEIWGAEDPALRLKRLVRAIGG